MRSRYTAFVKADMEYVKRTLAPESRKGFDVAEMKESAKQVKWKGLTVTATEKGGADDDTGTVTFIARYGAGEDSIEHHEVSTFRKDEAGQWFFVDGDAETRREGEVISAPQVTIKRDKPKQGRNDVCLCGSGKKFKKCCGAAA